MSNDLVLKIIFAAGSLKENIWPENPGFYEPPLPVLRMFWLTSAEKTIIFGGSLFLRLTAHCDSGNLNDSNFSGTESSSALTIIQCASKHFVGPGVPNGATFFHPCFHLMLQDMDMIRIDV